MMQKNNRNLGETVTKNFKMYKIGKQWAFAATVFVSLLGASALMGGTQTQVSADTVTAVADTSDSSSTGTLSASDEIAVASDTTSDSVEETSTVASSAVATSAVADSLSGTTDSDAVQPDHQAPVSSVAISATAAASTTADSSAPAHEKETRAGIEIADQGTLIVGGSANISGVTIQADGTYKGTLELIYYTDVSVAALQDTQYVINVPQEMRSLVATPNFKNYISGTYQITGTANDTTANYSANDISINADGSAITFNNPRISLGINGSMRIDVKIDLANAIKDSGVHITPATNGQNYTIKSALIYASSFFNPNFQFGDNAASQTINMSDIDKTDNSISQPTINTIYDDDTTITGTTQPNYSVELKTSTGTTLGTAKADASGNYSFKMKTALASGTVVNATAVYDGVRSATVSTIVLLRAAENLPAPVVTQPVTNLTSTITGTGTPGASVWIYDQANPDTPIAETSVLADGTYAANVSQPLDVGDQLYAIQTLGNAGQKSPATNFTVVQALQTPTIDQPLYSTAKTITGTATSGTTVTIKTTSGTTLGTATTAANGTYSITPSSKLVGGEQLIVSSSLDGQNSDTSTATVIAALDAPTINPVKVDDTKITGTATPADNLQVYITDARGNIIAGGPVNTDGSYSVTPIATLTVGETLYAFVTSDNVNSASVSTVVSDHINAPTVDPVYTDSTQITGTTRPGTTVQVTDANGRIIGVGTANDDGTYVVGADRTLVKGETLTVTAQIGSIASDPATTVVQDVIAAPVVNPVKVTDPAITGTATPNATIIVKDAAGNQIATGQVNSDGSYSVTPIRELVANETLNVTQKVGNYTSKPTGVTVQDVVPAPTVDEVMSTDTTVTGQSTRPNSIVTVKAEDGTVLGQGIVDNNGNWSVTLSRTPNVGEVLQVFQTFGSVQSATVDATVIAGLAAPKINQVTEDDLIITGSTMPGALVIVTDSNNKVLGEINADEDGDYSIGFNRQVVAGETLKVTVQDPSNAENKNSGTTVVVPDVQAPVIDTVAANSTAITGSGYPGGTINIYNSSNELVATGKVGSNGQYSAKVTLPLTAEESLTGQVTVNGHTGPSAQTKVIAAVLAPIINPVKDTDSKISGQTEWAGATITLTVAGQTLTGTTDAAGQFTIGLPSTIQLTAGQTISATVTVQQIISAAGTTVVTHVPTTPTINAVHVNDSYVTGTAEAGSQVILQDANNNTLGSAVVSDNGTYSIAHNRALTAGEVLTVTSVVDGNPSAKQATTVLDLGVTATPTINTVTEGDRTISGTATPGSTVEITDADGNEIGSIKVGVSGTYRLGLLDDAVVGQVLNATATSPNEKTSGIVSTTVQPDFTGKETEVNKVKDTDSVITGTGYPNGEVTVTDAGNNTIATGVVNADGSFTVTPSRALVGGEVLNVAVSVNRVPNAKLVTVIHVYAQPTVKNVTTTSIQITGTAEPNSNVYVTIGSDPAIEVPVNGNGDYTYTLPATLAKGTVIQVINGTGDSASTPATTTVTSVMTPTVNQPIYDSATTVGGKADPGAKVTVTDGDGNSLGTTTANKTTGIYTIGLSDSLTPGEHLIVTSNINGNPSEPVDVIVQPDFSGDNQTTINTVKDTDTVITGSGYPGGTFTITDGSGNTVATGTVGSDGTYSKAPNSALVAGEQLNSVVTVAGFPSNTATTSVIHVYGQPTVNDVTTASIQIIGKAEPNSMVYITIGTDAPVHVMAGSDGTYVYDLPATLPVGTEIQVINGTGDSASIPAATTVSLHLTTPVVTEPVKNTDDAVKGKADKGVLITITNQNGEVLGTTTSNKNTGSFTVGLSDTLNPGDILTVVATKDGSKPSTPANVEVHTDFTGQETVINKALDTDTVITGTGYAGGTVSITGNGGVIATGTVDANGNYSLTPNRGLVEGEVLKASVKVGFDTDSDTTTVIHVYVKPTVNEVTTGSTQITGTAEPGAPVYITIGSETAVQVTAGTNGKYVYDLPAKLTGGVSVSVVVGAGDSQSPAATTTVVQLPMTPQVKIPVVATDEVVSGKADPSASITVYDANGDVLGNTTANKTTGSFTVGLSESLTAGETLTVVSTLNGLTSENAQVIVQAVVTPLIVNPVGSMASYITGSGPAGGTVEFTNQNGESVASGTIGTDGKFNVEVTGTLNPGDVLTGQGTTTDGQTTPSVTVTVAKQIFSPTTDGFVTTASTSITVYGAYPGDIITITNLNNLQIYTGILDEGGAVTINIPAGSLTEYDVLRIVESDPNDSSIVSDPYTAVVRQA